MKYDLVIFDMDGTVLDTLDDLTAALNFALSRRGYPVRTREETKSFIGNGVRMLLKRGAGGAVTDGEISLMYRDFADWYRDHFSDYTRPYDGIRELLARLRDSGVKTALLSNKADFFVGELCERFFPGDFDLYYGEREGVPRKPEPDGVFDILRELGVAGERALYVGDSGVDLETAHRAGLDCVIVGWGYLNTEITPDPVRDLTAATPDDVFAAAAGKRGK